MYKLTSENYVIKGDLRFSIADSPEYPNTNPDYLVYREWLDAGGVPEPADPVPEIERIAAINASARNYLFSTDWYVIRLQETGQPVPDDVLRLRAEARLAVTDTPEAESL